MRHNKKPKRTSRQRTTRKTFRPGLQHKIPAFIVSFALVGGVFMLFSTKAAIPYVDAPHGSACIENSPSKLVVRPGETFTARVRLRNTGTSTYHSNFATALGELREGPDIWSASGKDLSRPVAPQEIATFNLTLKAPSKPGTYSFNWGIGIAYRGFMRTPCTGKSITVMNPPAVTLRANNTNGNISLTRGAGLTLSWSTTNSPSSCVASGSWSGGKPANGSENRAGDARTAGTRTYRLTCANAAGSGTATRTVTVNNPPPAPAPKPAPRPSPAPAPSTPSQTPSNPTPPAPQPSPPNKPAPENNPNPVSIPEPLSPTTFSALTVGDSTVRLTWSRANNDQGTQGYEVQRSTDNKNWETLEDLLTDEVYVDSTVRFETKYYYRVRSIGIEDKKSGFVLVEVTTNPFSSNTSGNDLNLESEDKQVSVMISDEALTEDAFCSLRTDSSTPVLDIKKHEIISGPYEVLCKNKSGAVLSSFNTDLEVSIRSEQGSYEAIKFYGYRENWREIANLTKTSSTTQPLDTPHFAVLGEKKSSSFIVKALIVLMLLVGTIVGGLVILNLLARYKQQQSIKSKIADYRSKERGY